MTNKLVAGFILFCALRLAAQPLAIPAAEALQLPTAARLATIEAAAQRDGWAPQTAGLRAAAVRAYQADKLAAAEAWLNVSRWSALLGETEAHFTARWIQAVNEAKVGHANMPSRFAANDRPLGFALSPATQAWLIGDAVLAEAFLTLLTPVDYAPKVFSILDDLYRHDPALCRNYAQLALAIAVVYDVPPPPNWPHAQVPADALPRKLPAALDAFSWWTREDQQGRTYQPLNKLPADELKFVVDAAAPFSELEWGQKIADIPLNSLARAYTMIRYRPDRVMNEKLIWPGKTYRLMDVLRDGGICVDQAYFATEIGKARGVPTLFFAGAGNDGRHAWFGFLDGNRTWQLDAGRYAEQRFVTGFARDPQTWGQLSDHEVQFLAERFRELPSYRSSVVHAEFAADFLAAGEATAAAAAARKAVNFERRNEAAWDTLIAATERTSRDPKAAEAVMREAALAFQARYPDLEALYVNRVSASLRARGQASEAEAEERRIARKNQSGRTDLSITQASDMVRRAIATQPLAGQISAYNSALDAFGRGAGIGFLDAVVRPFVEHLLQLRQPAEALHAVDRARNTLKVEPKSQLDQELTVLAKSVKTAK
jgi:hypothetical protein